MQWVVDGQHSAVAQFTKTGGVAWTVAAVGGGAVMGLFGALAGVDGQVFMIIGAALLVVTARTCGRVPCIHAVALSTGFGTVALGGLLILQTHGWLYLTF